MALKVLFYRGTERKEATRISKQMKYVIAFEKHTFE